MIASGNEALVVRALREPMPGAKNPGPHQLYRRPSLAIEARKLAPLAPGMVRLEMLLAGVCGTDLHVVHTDPATGYILSSAPLDLDGEGRVLGHEGVGRVVEVGAGVVGFGRGDVVTFESLAACGRCAVCRRGQANHCPHGRLVGMQTDGVFARFADLPARALYEAGDLAASPEGRNALACLEPAGCAHVATARARVRPGDRVAVFGAGPIGLFAAMSCRLIRGAAEVHVVEPIALRREVAAPWATRAWQPDEFAAHTSPIDVIIEASGQLTNVERVFARLQPGARVVLLARGGRALALDRIDHMITNGITIVGTRGHLGGAFDDVLALLRGGRLPLERAVTGVVDGLAGVHRELLATDPLERRHAKVLARLSSS